MAVSTEKCGDLQLDRLLQSVARALGDPIPWAAAIQ